MKKIVVFLLISSLALGCVACGKKEPNDTQQPPKTEDSQKPQNSQNPNSEIVEPGTDENVELNIQNPREILIKAWARYSENERFAIVGGHYSNYVDGAPADYDISKTEDLSAVFCIPQDAIAMIDAAASVQHGMNVNNFSAIAYHLAPDADMQQLIEAIKAQTIANQWLCGHPDKLIMITIGEEYLVTAYGKSEIIETFKSKVMNLYNNAPKLVVEQDL